MIKKKTQPIPTKKVRNRDSALDMYLGVLSKRAKKLNSLYPQISCDLHYVEAFLSELNLPYTFSFEAEDKLDVTVSWKPFEGTEWHLILECPNPNTGEVEEKRFINASWEDHINYGHLLVPFLREFCSHLSDSLSTDRGLFKEEYMEGDDS